MAEGAREGGVQSKLTIPGDIGWNSLIASLTVLKAGHSKASGVSIKVQNF